MKPLVLCILDGVGIRNEIHGNAFKMANTPTFDYLWNKYPHSLLEASSTFVGLPEGQMGNSEVGHMNIGAGRVVYQPLELINSKIKDKTFDENETILSIFEHVKKNKSKLHLCGLLSDGGVHSSINHLFKILELCKKENVDRVYLHLFLDGRDVLPDSAMKFIKELENKMKEFDVGTIATISGRYYAMDRDNRWDRIEKAYETMVLGKNKIDNIEEYIKSSYENKIFDEFIEPKTVSEDGMIESNDGIFVFNFRPDRLRELFQTFTKKDFKEFPTQKLENIKIITMMPISNEVDSTPAFKIDKLDDILGDIICKNGLRQLRIAETEKYAHVTYFFDGGEEKEYSNCDRILIPSPKVATYDLKPEMSAGEITDTLISKIENYDVVILNYANGDMLGHTGVINAAVTGIEFVDSCLKKLYDKIESLNGTLIITADHGNCEYMLDEQNRVITSHTTSKVPFIVCSNNVNVIDGKLGDIAPSILRILDIDKPIKMTGKCLVEILK